MKRLTTLLFAVIGLCSVYSCEAEKTYTVASKRGYTIDGESGLPFPLFYVRHNDSGWSKEEISGFEAYEPGYEYVIRAKYVDQLGYRDGYGKDHYYKVLQLQEILSKERRESVGLYDEYYYEDYLADPDEFGSQSGTHVHPSSINALKRIRITGSDYPATLTYSYSYDASDRLSSVIYDDGQGGVKEFLYVYSDDVLSHVTQGNVRYDYTFDSHKSPVRLEKSVSGVAEKTYEYTCDGGFLTGIKCSDGTEWRYSSNEIWEGSGIYDIVEASLYRNGIQEDIYHIGSSGTGNNFNVPVPGMSLPFFFAADSDMFLLGSNPSHSLPYEISKNDMIEKVVYRRESVPGSNIIGIDYDGITWELEYDESRFL